MTNEYTQAIDVVGFIRLMRGLFNADHVFLRELVQNSLEAIHRATPLESGSGRVQVYSDIQRGTISVVDDGVGMTAAELREKLLVLFRSGWQGDTGPTLGIGQFGFGFYSVFLAGDEVVVRSRSRRQPDECNQLTISAAFASPLIEVADSALPIGTSVTLHLRDSCRHFADDDFIRGELRQTFLYVPYPISVNDLPLGLASRDGWTRTLSNRVDTDEIASFFQTRYEWDEQPLIVGRFASGIRGYLAVIPQAEFAPPVEVYRRGIYVTRSELIAEPLNYVMCGVVDCDNVNVKPDRETLVADPAQRELRDCLSSNAVRLLARAAERQPEQFRQVLRVHRQPLTLAMLRRGDLRTALGPSYTVRRYLLPSSFERDREATIAELLEARPAIVWLEDVGTERALADRAYHLGQQPVVIEPEPEQELVRRICKELGVGFRRVSDVFLDEMRARVAHAPRTERLFRLVLPDECELVCCIDEDERLPVRVMRPSRAAPRLAADLEGESDSLLRLLFQALRGTPEPRFVTVINIGNPMIAQIESGDGDFSERELSLARLLFFMGRLASGISVSAEETWHVCTEFLKCLDGDGI